MLKRFCDLCERPVSLSTISSIVTKATSRDGHVMALAPICQFEAWDAGRTPDLCPDCQVSMLESLAAKARSRVKESLA